MYLHNKRQKWNGSFSFRGLIRHCIKIQGMHSLLQFMEIRENANYLARREYEQRFIPLALAGTISVGLLLAVRTTAWPQHC